MTPNHEPPVSTTRGAPGNTAACSCLICPNRERARTSTLTPSGTSRSIVPKVVRAWTTTSGAPIRAWRRSSWMFPNHER